MRFWIDRACLQNQQFLITGSLYHHICRVSKIKKGETFELFCEGSQKYKVFLSSVSAKQALAQVIKAYPVPPLKKPYLKLAISLPKLSKLESLLESAVQLGLKEIQPFVSDFSFLKKSSQLKPERYQRWQKIIDSHKALTARTEDLKIQPLKPLADLLFSKEDQILIAYENSKNSLKKILAQKSPKKPAPLNVWLFIGSEGGFSKSELENLKKIHPWAKDFSLGDQILKVETAGLVALSLLKYHYHL